MKISPSRAYALAEEGLIPTVIVGGGPKQTRRRVPLELFKRKLEERAELEAQERVKANQRVE